MVQGLMRGLRRVSSGLLLALVSEDADARDRLEGVVGRHLVRFGVKDELVCQWVRTDGTPGTLQRNADEETGTPV